MKNKEKYAKEIVEIVCEGCALAVSKEKEHYAGMAEHPPDRKASEDFHRPAYQANNMIRIQGQQLEHITVEEYLAKKYHIKEADAGGAETGRK